MTTEFLKKLGIEDQSVINAIFAENGKDVNAAKGELSNITSELENAKAQLAERDSQLKDLRKSAGDNEALVKQLSEMEKANKDAQKAFEEKLSATNKNHAIEDALRDAKARNLKAVMAQLDTDKITYIDGTLVGLQEQITALQGSEDTSFLFGDPTPPSPVGTQPFVPGNNGAIGGLQGDNTPKTMNQLIADYYSK